jgi:O-antigen/teichoic acid export membrane protein
MKLPVDKLVNGAIWTAGAFGIGQALRFATNIVLARVLAPELFGLMVIVNTVRLGTELISDIGINQNIVYSKNSDDPQFYNTAWSLQVIRSVILWIFIAIAAIPIAKLYNITQLSSILAISGLTTVFAGLTSVSVPILEKKMKFSKLNVFTVVTSAFSSAALIVFAYLNPTIWALVFGSLVGSAFNMFRSHYLIPELKQRFYIKKEYVVEIMGFGKWIFLSSIVFFFAGNFDRLYFGKVVPLGLLGIYGIARNISDLFGAVATRIGGVVVFPFIASHFSTPRETLRYELGSIRLKFLLLMAVGCSLLIATADLAIKLLYDSRYHAATWILPILVVGAWFSMIAAINESTILGLGKPSYTALANGVRLILLLIALPLSFTIAGLVGSVMTLAVIEAFRNVPMYVGLKREGFAFGFQDLSVTLMMFAMTGVLEWVRWTEGFGTSFDSLFASLPK